MTIHAFVCRRPAFHMLCSDVFLPEPIQIDTNTSVIPLAPLGKSPEADCLAAFLEQIGDPRFTDAKTNFLQQGLRHRPCVLASAILEQGESPDEVEALGTPILRGVEVGLSCITGNRPVVFAVIAVTKQASTWAITSANAPQQQYNFRFSNTGTGWEEPLQRLIYAYKKDDRFAFATSLFIDALGEDNPEFKAARLFTCMEALAYRLKQGGLQSRDAVRKLFEGHVDTRVRTQIRGEWFTYDVVEVCGRIRDKLFHGAPFDVSDLKPDLRPYYGTMLAAPSLLLQSAQNFCVIALEKRAEELLSGDRDAS